MNSKIIGKRMHDLRKKRGLTMHDLSKLIGLSQPQISRLEKGEQGFRSETLGKIAQALKVDTAYFLQDWAPDGALKNLRLDADLMAALRDPEFFLLVRKLATSRTAGGRLIGACLALVDAIDLR